MTIPFRRSLLSVVFLAALALPLAAQDAPAPDTGKPQAVTTGDPAVAVENLDLRLDPLTKSELGVEAEGWRDLVQAGVKALSDARLATHRKNKEIKAAADAEAAGMPTLPPTPRMPKPRRTRRRRS